MTRAIKLIPLAALLGATSAWGLAPIERPARATLLREPKAAGLSETQDNAVLAPAARRFEDVHGGAWEFRVDPRTGRAAMVQGTGVPLIPGRGNALGIGALRGRPLADGEVDLGVVEGLARKFLAAHADLVGVPEGVLELDPGRSMSLDDGRLWTLDFVWRVGGVPVEGAGVFVRVNAGNVTQFGAPLVGPVRLDTRPSLDGPAALAALLRYAGDEELARVQGDGPRLVIQPEDAADGTLAYRLVWIARWKTRGGHETWEGRLDAHTGEVVGFRDANLYGRITGGVYQRTVTDPEIRVPFPLVRLDGSATVTSTAGYFPYAGGAAASGLNGLYFDTVCEGCTSPVQPSVGVTFGAGLLDFGLGGVDMLGNGYSTKADRNAFYHLTQARRIGKKWLPSLGWLDQNMPATVNINDSCNAFYDGTVNFFRSSAACNNTGEIADVMQHEWGHGIDFATRGGDIATSEATGDTVAMHMTHDARIGPYFNRNGNPVRDLEKARVGIMTRTNLPSRCPAGSGPLGFEVHCEGEVLGQTMWDLAQSLAAKHGHHTGWRVSERNFFTSLPSQGSYLPTQPFPLYDAIVQADDDDGNLGNGTPNGAEIYAAFNLHAIAGTPRVSSAACVRPGQPELVATPGCDRVSLSWAAVASAASYTVFRGEVLADSAYFPVAVLGAAAVAYEDTEVAPDTDYHYVVMAKTAGGCESTVENPSTVRLTPQAVLQATVVSVSDVPRGNRSGSADPGEEVDLVVTLANSGAVASSGLTGTLVADTPGVTIVEGAAAWPAVAPGAQAAAATAFRFDSDEVENVCGQALRFHVVPDDASACVPNTSYFEVPLGIKQNRYAANFEAGLSGWALDETLSDAATGDWTWGDPDPSGYQSGNDATADPGQFCWFTSPNPSGDSVNDVDDGTTVIVSPNVDLSGLARATLSYARWFANRDLGEDPGDFFKADVSADGGATWVNLETLGTTQSAAAWTTREFALETAIPLTAQVRIRFQAADGLAAPNVIEAAIDDVRIDTAVCDPTPACFTAPTFAGIASLAPGASCGKTLLGWTAASSNCTNATMRYSVYRSTDPGFTPSPSNRVASGLTALAYTDTGLAPGGTYTYVVRADDSRSGEDANAVKLTITAPSSPDLDAPTFKGLGAAATGAACGQINLIWSQAGETCSPPVSYEIHRSTTPGFAPSAANRIAVTQSVGYADAAVPGTTYYYVVRARDRLGNGDANVLQRTASSGVSDRLVLTESFESGAAGWGTVAPNDVATGPWELGDPEPTGVQPADDATPPPGVVGWFTGLAAAGGDGGNDVDTGTTTLRSAAYDLTGLVSPAIRYARWFTNDLGAAPGEDPLDVAVSNDDGATWSPLEQVGAGTPLAWVVQQTPLPIAASASVRVRFTARDLGSGSLVEAGIDDFAIVDRNQGCGGCPAPVAVVGTIFVSRVGNDAVIDWTGDPVAADRYAVYRSDPASPGAFVRIGTTTSRLFVHAGAALLPGSFYYRVAALDACGAESALE